jgi:hypothetical protein
MNEIDPYLDLLPEPFITVLSHRIFDGHILTLKGLTLKS